MFPRIHWGRMGSAHCCLSPEVACLVRSGTLRKRCTLDMYLVESSKLTEFAPPLQRAVPRALQPPPRGCAGRLRVTLYCPIVKYTIRSMRKKINHYTTSQTVCSASLRLAFSTDSLHLLWLADSFGRRRGTGPLRCCAQTECR